MSLNKKRNIHHVINSSDFGLQNGDRSYKNENSDLMLSTWKKQKSISPTISADNSRMEWPPDRVIALIEAYESYPALWDITNPTYKDRNVKRDALTNLASEFRCRVNEIEKKMCNLKCQFRREYTKERRSQRELKVVCSSEGQDATAFESKWFAYNSLENIMRGNRMMRNRDPSEYRKKSASAQVKIEITGDEGVSGPEGQSEDSHLDEDLNGGCTSGTGAGGDSDDGLSRHLMQPSQSKAVMDLRRELLRSKDEFSTFGDYVASQLRNLSDLNALAVAKHLIGLVLFEAEVGKYDSVPEHSLFPEQQEYDPSTLQTVYLPCDTTAQDDDLAVNEQTDQEKPLEDERQLPNDIVVSETLIKEES